MSAESKPAEEVAKQTEATNPFQGSPKPEETINEGNANGKTQENPKGGEDDKPEEMYPARDEKHAPANGILPRIKRQMTQLVDKTKHLEGDKSKTEGEGELGRRASLRDRVLHAIKQPIAAEQPKNTEQQAGETKSDKAKAASNEEGRSEGKREGKGEGKNEGKGEGKSEGKLQSVLHTVKHKIWEFNEPSDYKKKDAAKVRDQAGTAQAATSEAGATDKPGSGDATETKVMSDDEAKKAGADKAKAAPAAPEGDTRQRRRWSAVAINTLKDVFLVASPESPHSAEKPSQSSGAEKAEQNAEDAAKRGDKDAVEGAQASDKKTKNWSKRASEMIHDIPRSLISSKPPKEKEEAEENSTKGTKKKPTTSETAPEPVKKDDKATSEGANDDAEGKKDPAVNPEAETAAEAKDEDKGNTKV